MNNGEKIQEPTPELSQESQIDNSPETHTETRTQKINQQINSYQGPRTPEDLTAKTNEIQENYQQYIEESDAEGNQETLQLFQNKMQDEIKFYEEEAKRQSDLERLKKASEVLTPEDFQKLESYLGNQEGSLQNIFDPKGKLLHTTNSYAFLNRILPNKKLLQKVHGYDENGEYFEKLGTYFTDGDFEKALTFNNVWDDSNEYVEQKDFNAQKYKDKTADLIEYFWEDDERREIAKKYLGKLGDTTLEDTDIEKAVEIAQSFKRKPNPEGIKDNIDELNKMFGINLVFKKNDIQDTTKHGAQGIQNYFEQRVYDENGVSLNDLEVILVPNSKINEIKKILDENGLTNVEVRASEELEVRNFMENINKINLP